MAFAFIASAWRRQLPYQSAGDSELTQAANGAVA